MKFVFINTGNISQNAGIVRCLGLGTQLARLGHDVTVMINDDPMNVKDYGNIFNGIKFLYTRSGSGKEHISKLVELLKLKDADYVHCMGAGSSIYFPALIAKKVFRKRFRLIVDFEDKQSLLVPKKQEKQIIFYEKLAIRYADIILSASKELADLYSKTYGKPVSYMPFALEQRRTIRRDTATAGIYTVGYLGNLIRPYREQVDFLLEAIKIMVDKGIPVQLLIAGKGEMQPEFEAVVKQLNLTASVQFKGFIADDQLDAFFGKLDACVFYLPDTPINKYRCPNKAFMYASTGLPIVASRVGEVVRVLKDYPNATFFDNDNIDNFITAVVKAKEFGSSVPDSFYAKNSWEFRTKEYLDFIK